MLLTLRFYFLKLTYIFIAVTDVAIYSTYLAVMIKHQMALRTDGVSRLPYGASCTRLQDISLDSLRKDVSIYVCEYCKALKVCDLRFIFYYNCRTNY